MKANERKQRLDDRERTAAFSITLSRLSFIWVVQSPWLRSYTRLAIPFSRLCFTCDYSSSFTWTVPALTLWCFAVIPPPPPPLSPDATLHWKSRGIIESDRRGSPEPRPAARDYAGAFARRSLTRLLHVHMFPYHMPWHSWGQLERFCPEGKQVGRSRLIITRLNLWSLS